MSEPQPNEVESTEPQSAEEPEERALTPLQRVKAQQAAMQKNRQKGARQAQGRSEEAGPGEGPHQRVQIQRRSGGA